MRIGISMLDFLWKEIVKGLQEKPAYLLIFALCALFILGGGIGSIVAASKGNYYILFGLVFLLCFSLFIAYLTICKVEPSPDIIIRKRDEIKLLMQLKSAHPKVTTDLERLQIEVQNLLQKYTRTGDFRIGFRYKDPSKILPMTHKIVGLPGEVDRMANIMAAFIRLTIRKEKLNFQKIVFPKTGNVLFTIKAAERVGRHIIGFRGRDYAIADDESLSVNENYFDGILNENDKVLIIDDITFRGDTIKETISFLEAAKAKVIAVFVLCAHKNRLEKLRRELDEEYGGIKFFPIIEIDKPSPNSG